MDVSNAPLRVLLIENQADLISTITLLLSDIKECQVQSFPSYQEALAHGFPSEPDLLLFADSLEGDALETLREIRMNYPSLYIIASLTASNDETIRVYQERGVNGFIYKDRNYIPDLVTEVRRGLIRIIGRKAFLHSSISGSNLFSRSDSADLLQFNTLQPGQLLLHYRIVEELGEGGMGQVFKAEDQKLGRFVAIKVLPPRVTRNEQARLRLNREARTASALNHPNIITIYAIEESMNLSFIVMEYIEGVSLWKMLQSSKIELATLLDIGIQLADALSVAHAVPLIHRDIKPANVMITPRGQAKLLDFGLAKWIPTLSGGKDERASINELTESGVAVGTVSYMSPEQALGEPLDGRSDIFSLGCVLFEAATGKHPFEAPSIFAIMHKIVNEGHQHARTINSSLPPDFDEILSQTLAKDKNKRYSAAELVDALKMMKGSLVRDVPTDPMAGTVKASGKAQGPSSGSRKDSAPSEILGRIVLVEDNEDNRDMLSRRLKRKGFDVLIAVSGEEAVEIVPREKPDVVLMDISLPLMDGFEATRRLKTDPETKSIPIIALTAHAMSGDKEKALAAGCDDYDTKPVDIQRLLTKIDLWLKRKL